MSRTTLIALILVAALAVVAATLVTRQQSASVAAAGAKGKIFDGLTARVNDVAEVRVQRGSAADGLVTLKRSAAGAWELADRGAYPAKFEKVKEVIVGLAELEKEEELTSRPEGYKTLGVQDPSSVKPEEGAASAEAVPTLITLKDDKGAELASLIVGQTKWGQVPTVYVRKPGEAASWLASGRLEIPAQLTGWVEAEFLKVPRERIKLASTTQPDGGVLVVERTSPTDANFAVQNVPEGKKLRSPAVGDSLAIGLASVALDDVAPIETINFAGGSGWTPGPKAEFRTFDGLMILVELVDNGPRTWAKFGAAFDESVKPPEGATGLKSAEDVKKEVASLNETFSKYAFSLPAWKAGVFKTQMKDMLEETPPQLPANFEQQGNTIVPLSTPPEPLPAPTPPK